MKVQLEKSYPMPASADTGWALLQDIEGVASCMPGAKITEKVDAQHYKGTVSVKLGPASLSFRGEISVLGIDAAARSLHLFAKGTDTTGGSAASMDLTARVEAVDAASCNLVGTSEVTMSGKAATFGGRVMGPVSDQILGQFAANFAAKVQAMRDAASTPGAAATPPPVNEPKPLNGLALVWAVIKGWFRSLFSAKRS
jgi:carbon monoxide dehydrogenase subunit G